MKILEIFEKALDQNIDCDEDGKVTGKWFAIEQIFRDMRNLRYGIFARGGKKMDTNAIIDAARKRQK